MSSTRIQNASWLPLFVSSFLLLASSFARAESAWVSLDLESGLPAASPTALELIDVLCSEEGAPYFVDDGVLEHIDCSKEKHKGQNWGAWIVLDPAGQNGIGALPISSRRGRRLYFAKSNGVWKIIGKATSGPSDGNCAVVSLKDGHRLMTCLDSDGGQGHFGYWVTLFDGERIINLRDRDRHLFSSNEGGARLVNGYCYEIIPDAIQITGRIESYAVQLRVRGKKQGVANETSTGGCGGFTPEPEFANALTQLKSWILSGTVKEGKLQFDKRSQIVQDEIESFLKK